MRLGGQEAGFRRSLAVTTFYDGYVRRMREKSGQNELSAVANAPESRRTYGTRNGGNAGCVPHWAEAGLVSEW